jgi:hypothetical protein
MATINGNILNLIVLLAAVALSLTLCSCAESTDKSNVYQYAPDEQKSSELDHASFESAYLNENSASETDDDKRKNFNLVWYKKDISTSNIFNY